MKPIRRSYNSETDLGAVLALKQVCTTPQNIYDAPTRSDFQRLLAPEAFPLTATSDGPFRGKMTQEQAQRIMTQHLTAVWEDASGTMLAYALIAQPGRSLTFQVHPQAAGQGLETAILAWGLEQMQAIAQVVNYKIPCRSFMIIVCRKTGVLFLPKALARSQKSTISLRQLLLTKLRHGIL